MRHQTSVAVLGHLGAPLLSSSLADQLIHIGTCSSSSVQYSNCWHWPLLCWTDIAVSSRSDSPPPPPPWRRKICSSARPNWPAGRAWNSSCGIQSPTSCSAVPPRVGVSGAICRPASRCDLLLPPPPFFPALLSASFSCPFIAFHRTSFTELVGFYQDLARTSLWGWYGLYCLLLGFTASDSSMPPPRPSLVDLLTGLGRAEEKNNVLLSPSHAGVAPIDMKGTFSVYGSRLPCPSKAASDPARERNKR